MGFSRVIELLAFLLESELSTAPIVNTFVEGGNSGAMYSPAAEIVPVVALPPGTPFTDQFAVTGAPLSVAVKDCVLPLPTCRLPLVGDTETVTGEGTGMAARQAFVPAVAGAELVAAVEPTVTVAGSCLPASSVTVSVTLNVPLAGAVTVVEGPVEFVTG